MSRSRNPKRPKPQGCVCSYCTWLAANADRRESDARERERLGFAEAAGCAAGACECECDGEPEYCKTCRAPEYACECDRSAPDLSPVAPLRLPLAEIARAA